jgi:hypothetical protein
VRGARDGERFTNLAEAGYVMIRRKEVEILDVAELRPLAVHEGPRPGVAPAVATKARAPHVHVWLADLENGLGVLSEACTDRHQVAPADSRHAVAHHGIRALT